MELGLCLRTTAWMLHGGERIITNQSSQEVYGLSKRDWGRADEVVVEVRAAKARQRDNQLVDVADSGVTEAGREW